MSRIGSGNRIRSSKKAICEAVNKIDIFTLKQNGALVPGSCGVISWDRNGNQTGSIDFSVDELCLMLNPESAVQLIRFDWTNCNYGGKRTWFLCPECNMRVATLFSGNQGFACRKCYDLQYECQSESDLDRQYRKIRKLRKKLGGSDNLIKRLWLKPKGMHRETFERLRDVEKGMKQRLQVQMLALLTGIFSRN